MLFIFLVTTFAFSQSPGEPFDKKVDTLFHGQPEVAQRFRHYLHLTDIHFQNLDDPQKWYEARMNYSRSKSCLDFLLAGTPQDKERYALFREYWKLKSYDKIDHKDFELLMKNRDLRKKMMEDDKVELEERYKFCSPELPEEIVKKRKPLIAEYLKERDSKPKDYSMFHPRIAMILKDFDERAKKSNLKPQEYEIQKLRVIQIIIPTLDTKAKIEFLPNVERNCPGIVDKYWDKCKQDEKYGAKGLFPDIGRMFCIQDHESEIDPKCLK